ncbi:hypothetical protein [Streptomyces hayashii]|uniref:hypothetical protein n=1 Tax=Streptomyces hayashii TaxID=2839966 RepID=UPI00403CEE59
MDQSHPAVLAGDQPDGVLHVREAVLVLQHHRVLAHCDTLFLAHGPSPVPR